MIWLIICPLMYLALTGKLARRVGRTLGKGTLALYGALGLLFGLLLAFYLGTWLPTESVLTDTVQLAPFKYPPIEEAPEYYVVEERSETGMVYLYKPEGQGVSSLSVSDQLFSPASLLYESDETVAELQVYMGKFTDPRYLWIGIQDPFRVYVLYVPKGTVRKLPFNSATAEMEQVTLLLFF